MVVISLSFVQVYCHLHDEEISIVYLFYHVYKNCFLPYSGWDCYSSNSLKAKPCEYTMMIQFSSSSLHARTEDLRFFFGFRGCRQPAGPYITTHLVIKSLINLFIGFPHHLSFAPRPLVFRKQWFYFIIGFSRWRFLIPLEDLEDMGLLKTSWASSGTRAYRLLCKIEAVQNHSQLKIASERFQLPVYVSPATVSNCAKGWVSFYKRSQSSTKGRQKCLIALQVFS